MLCKSCQYPLWKLAARACPECGASFKPSEYDFRPETVRFCCPQCWQVYYGTDDRGLIVPREFDCVKCAKRIELDSMVLLPAAGFESEHATEADVVPWIERKSIGFWRALWRTLVMGAFTPGRLGEALARDRTTRTGLVYSFLINVVFGVLGGGILLFFPVAIALAAMLSAGAMRGPVAGLLGFVVLVLFTAIAALAVTVLGVLLWAGSAHAVLVMTGSQRGTYRGTLRGLAFTSGANLLQGIPCLGGYFSPISWIWWAISAGLCIARTHRVSAARAITATVAFPAIVFVMCMSALVFWGIPAMANLVQQAQAASRRAVGQAQQTIATTRTGSLTKLLVTHAEADALPPHAAELLMDRRAFPTDFILQEFGGPEPVVAGLALSAFSRLSEANRAQPKTDLLALVSPAGLHRVGDFVLCYQGAWKRSPAGDTVLPVDPGLWVVICDPLIPPVTPGMNGQSFDGVAVAQADGTTVKWIASSDLAAALADQNALRVSLGLPPLDWAPRVPPSVVPTGP
jgi:hypothetical protein